MNVTDLKNTSQFVLQSNANRHRAAVDFKATLEAAGQNLAQTGKNAARGKSAGDAQASQTPTAKTAAQELEEYLKKTPAQHMRDAILKEMGLTEDDLADMPPEKRQAIEDTIAAKIKEKLLDHNELTKNPAQAQLATQALLMKSMA